ncbi:hypothetical protein GCM10010136_11330 [Limoniibacter endophyticus]|uniref:Uncharacterized protein n=1 Tax=Limoniibacter endophyticus TaxID=1565040 RepID=A0A8J3DFV7_9HYPH|nr:hypothetical protein GCM10010136_11330 [Limoniibacter endophyticus]
MFAAREQAPLVPDGAAFIHPAAPFRSCLNDEAFPFPALTWEKVPDAVTRLRPVRWSRSRHGCVKPMQ